MNRTVPKQSRSISCFSQTGWPAIFLALALLLTTPAWLGLAGANASQLLKETAEAKPPLHNPANMEPDNLKFAQVRGQGQSEPADRRLDKDKKATAQNKILSPSYWKKRNQRYEDMSWTVTRALSRTDELFFEGFGAYSKGQCDKAIAKLTKLLREDPKYNEVYIIRGLAYAQLGRYEQAIADFTHYIKIEPRDAEAYYNRGLAYAVKGQFDQALADVNQALKLSSQDAQARYLRGFVYYKKGQSDQAKADFQMALKLDPNYVEEVSSEDKSEMARYSLILQGKVPKPPKPEVVARKTEAAHKQQGLVLARQDQYDRAISEFTQALAIDPRDAETYNNRGSIYTLKGQYDAAMTDFTKALSLNPRYAKAYYNRALANYYQGRHDQAIADLTKAIELKPKDADSYNNRGLAYMQQGKYEQAIDDFNLAVILNPKLADAYFNKAVSCEKAGRQDEAREAYAAFIKSAPPGAAAQMEQARRQLQR